jgi:polyisoprenoid-binding protein YceI
LAGKKSNFKKNGSIQHEGQRHDIWKRFHLHPNSSMNFMIISKSRLQLTYGFVALTLLASGSFSAADTVRYTPVPNSSKLRIDGTSTIHDWHADTGVVGGFMEMEATFPDPSGKSAPSAIKPKIEVKIPVRSLQSSGGKRMDAVMQEHMKLDQHKIIDYRVLELTPKAGTTAGPSAQFDAKGTLTIAGVTRTNTMPVTIERTDKQLKVKGSTALKMTDFGIQPPAPDVGLGLIRTGDDIKLTFEWVTEPKAP